MAAQSATNRKYMESLSPNGLQSTYSLRGQNPRNTPQRTMSLSNRSFRNSEPPRTMSLRSNAYANQRSQQVSRSMSMTSNSVRPNRPASVMNSRTNSLTASSRGYQQPRIGSRTGSIVGSRTGSRSGSRTNSLSSSTAPHTKIIKTTKETDHVGRTKSITTTTIEKHGDMKIIRTTVVQPADDAIDEDAELEALAELEDFDHDNTVNEYQNDNMSVDDYNNDYYDDGYEQQGQEDDFYDDPMRNGAASAALAALTGTLKENPRIKQRQNIPKNVQQRPKSVGQQHANNRQYIEPKQEVRFKEASTTNVINDTKNRLSNYNNYEDESGQRNQQKLQQPSVKNSRPAQRNQPTKNVLTNLQQKQLLSGASSISSGERSRNSNHGQKSVSINESPVQLQYEMSPTVHTTHSIDQTDDYIDSVTDMNEQATEMMVVTPQISVSDSFQSKARKRLSEIQEVTEIYDDANYDQPADDEDYMEEPIVNALGIDKSIQPEQAHQEKHYKGRATTKETYDFGKPTSVENLNATTVSSLVSDDNFVEASESFANERSSAANERANVHSTSHKADHSQTAHSYRNLLFNEAKRSPIKNSIPQFDGSHTDYANVDEAYTNNKQRVSSQVSSQNTTPIIQQSNTFTNFDQLEDNYASNTSTHSKQKQLKLKSALKNSSSSLASPISDNFYKPVNNMPTQPINSQRGKPIPKQVISPPKKELSPEEMYTLALKAAEKKVYGDRINQAYPDADIDDDTKLNTMVNMQATSGAAQALASGQSQKQNQKQKQKQNRDSQVNSQLMSTQNSDNSHPGVPYHSNASGVGFRVHSLRGETSVSRHSKRVDPEESGKLKKFFKNEQKQQKKQWEEERKAAVESGLVKQAAASVEKEVNVMPIDPTVQLHLLQQREEDKFEQEMQAAQTQNQTNTNGAVTNNSSQIQPPQPLPQFPQSSSSTPASTPKKNKLRLFGFGKKKSPGNELSHNRRESIISQETQNSLNRRTSMDGKKGKLFSFGFGNGNGQSHETNVNPNVAQQPVLQKIASNGQSQQKPQSEKTFQLPHIEEMHPKPNTSTSAVEASVPDDNVATNSHIASTNMNTIPEVEATDNAKKEIMQAPTINGKPVKGLDSTVTNDSPANNVSTSGGNFSNVIQTDSSKYDSIAQQPKTSINPNSNNLQNNAVETTPQFIKTEPVTVTNGKVKQKKGSNKFMKFFNL